jgi:hypothetical protein
VTDDLQAEVSKMLGLLSILTDSDSKPDAGSGRQIAKSNQDITASLHAIAELCEDIRAVPVSTPNTTAADCNACSHLLLRDLTSLAAISLETDDGLKSCELDPAFAQCQVSLAAFRQSLGPIPTDTDFPNGLAALDSLLQSRDRLTFNVLTEAVSIVRDLRSSIASSTAAVVTTKSVNELPLRFTPSIPATPARGSVAELKLELDLSTAATRRSLQVFLSAASSNSESLFAELSDLHANLSQLIGFVDRLQVSTLNADCKSRLVTVHTNLVNFGDAAIGAARDRESISQLVDSSTAALDSLLAALGADSREAITNEAERELVAAAEAVAASQARMEDFKAVAEQRRLAIGEGYIGCEIVEIAAPILNTAANLIGAAQQQTKFLLQKDPNLPNQSGLVKTAGGLVDSLELILVAAEATVNNEPNAMAKVLASCNLISSAVAHFLAECHQKNGDPELNVVMTKIVDSIQGMIKQLRTFCEKAYESQTSAQQAAKPGKQLNSLVERLNAEGAVAEARKALEAAELKLKRLRQATGAK